MRLRFSTWLNIGLLLLLFILTQIIGSLSGMLLRDCNDSISRSTSISLMRDSDLQPLGLLIGSLMLILLLWALGLIPRRILKRLRPTWPTFSWLCVIFFLVTALGMSFLAEALSLDDMMAMDLMKGFLLSPIGWLLVCFFAPLSEELLFREAILRQFTQSGMSRAMAAVLSALLFAIVHFNPAQAVPAFVMGLLLAYLYYMVGDIRLSLLAHVVNNTCSAVLLQFPQLDEPLTHYSLITQLFIAAALVGAGSIGFIWIWETKKQEYIGNMPNYSTPTAYEDRND